MACSLCCYTAEDCPDCGECICECRCDDYDRELAWYDDGEDDPVPVLGQGGAQ